MDSSFGKLKDAFTARKDNAIVEKEDGVTTMTFTDVVYSIDPKRKDENINFQAIGLDFMVDPTGNFYIVQAVDGDILAHEIDDANLKSRLKAHLEWRSEVMVDFGI